MRDLLDGKLGRFEELEKQLIDPEVLANSARLAAVAREHGSLAKLATKFRRFKRLNQEITEARQMIEGTDPDMRELAAARIRPRTTTAAATRSQRLGLGTSSSMDGSFKSVPPRPSTSL